MEYPILMADIINSRKINSTELITDFKFLVKAINKKWRKEILSPLTITLGDEFQGVISSKESAIKIIFDLEEEIIKSNYPFKLRYVLNIGKIDTAINKTIAYEMLGDGLTTAREKLTELKKNKNRFHIITSKVQQSNEIINDLFKIYENYIENWKTDEFYIVSEFLQEKTYQEVAENLEINISSSWRRQKSLNIDQYFLCKKLILSLNSILYEK